MPETSYIHQIGARLDGKIQASTASKLARFTRYFENTLRPFSALENENTILTERDNLAASMQANRDALQFSDAEVRAYELYKGLAEFVHAADVVKKSGVLEGETLLELIFSDGDEINPGDKFDVKLKGTAIETTVQVPWIRFQDLHDFMFAQKKLEYFDDKIKALRLSRSTPQDLRLSCKIGKEEIQRYFDQLKQCDPVSGLPYMEADDVDWLLAANFKEFDPPRDKKRLSTNNLDDIHIANFLHTFWEKYRMKKDKAPVYAALLYDNSKKLDYEDKKREEAIFYIANMWSRPSKRYPFSSL